MVSRKTCFVYVIVLLAMAVAACQPVSRGGATAVQPAKYAGATTGEAPPAPQETAPTPLLASQPSVLRFRTTADVLKGTVMRVEGVAEVTPGPRLAGYLIRAGTERPLSPEHLNELVVLVRSDSGFDDSIVKRCRPGTSLGFRLFRKLTLDRGPTVEPVTELVLDFGCGRLTVAEAGAKGALQTAYFDPSRAAFVAFAKRVLPDDSELGKLR